jgi:hypothetical protein
VEQVSTYGLDSSSSFERQVQDVGSAGRGGLGVADHHYRHDRGREPAHGKRKQMPAAPIPDFETYTRSADPIGFGAPIGHGMGFT